MRVSGPLQKLLRAGLSPHAFVPGIYAWAVTVAPSAALRGASSAALVGAGVSAASLFASVVSERRWGPRVRTLWLWGFVFGSALTWASTPEALSPSHLDPVRGMAGMLGWSLFALAFAASPSRNVDASVQEAPRFTPRVPIARQGLACVIAGTIIAAALQQPGWECKVPERALLVRLVALAGGIALVGMGADVATAALARARPVAWRLALRRAALPGLILLALAAGGLLLRRPA